MDEDTLLALQEPREIIAQGAPTTAGGFHLARNTALNFAGQLVPLIAGASLIPYLTRGFGPDRFGVLGIVWLVFGYFSLFDFGLGRATTKFLAQWIAAGQTTLVSEMVWASVAIQVLLGVAGGLLLMVLTPMLVTRVLKIPPDLVVEARNTFLILSATLPVVLFTSGLRAVLEGIQRFDIANFLRIPMSSLAFAIPAASLPFGLRLPGIVLLLALSRVAFAVAHLFLCLRVLPCLRSRPSFQAAVVLPLLSFGSWVTVANFVNPVLVSMERFLIGSMLSMAMVGYYTAPFEAITKLWIVPGSLAAAIFPACSALGSDRRHELGLLYARSIKYLFLVLAPISLLLFLLARQITQLWLGSDFAVNSAPVLQLLVIGVFVNCFAHVPYSFLQGLGRPDAAAKLFLAELVPYAGFVWWMIRHQGLPGAAAAWSIRAALEVLILMFIAWRIFYLSPRGLLNRRMLISVAVLCAMGLTMVGVKVTLRNSLVIEICMSGIWLAGFALAIWKYVFDDSDRASVLALVSPLRNAVRNRAVG